MKLINSSIVFLHQASLFHYIIHESLGKTLKPDLKSKMRVSIPPHPIIINYDGGYSNQILLNKTIIQINYPHPKNLISVSSTDDKLSLIADEFYKKYKNCVFNAFGVNFKLLASKQDISHSTNLMLDEAEIIDYKFSVNKDIFKVTMSVQRVVIQDEGKDQDSLLIEANFHLDLSLKEKKDNLIQRGIEKREDCFLILKELIDARFS